jgi:general secretion pathway protein I
MSPQRIKSPQRLRKSLQRIKSPQRAGFTLVEVLIALVVFAVLGFTVSSRVGDVVNQTFSIERRTVAHWVASNYLNRLRIARRATVEPVDTGRDRERITMAGRDWLLDIEVSETAQETFRRVEIEVFELIDGEEVGPLDSVIGFLGQY